MVVGSDDGKDSPSYLDQKRMVLAPVFHFQLQRGLEGGEPKCSWKKEACQKEWDSHLVVMVVMVMMVVVVVVMMVVVMVVVVVMMMVEVVLVVNHHW